MTDPDETYLTVAEVAAKLKLNQQTVRNWIDADRLPALRVGRRVRIKQSDFDRLVADSYSGGAPVRGREPEQTADGFWGGEPVGRAEPGETGGQGEGRAAGDGEHDRPRDAATAEPAEGR